MMVDVEQELINLFRSLDIFNEKGPDRIHITEESHPEVYNFICEQCKKGKTDVMIYRSDYLRNLVYYACKFPGSITLRIPTIERLS